MDNTVKEPLIHLSKREDMSFGKKWLVRIIAILLSLIVCAGFIFIIIKRYIIIKTLITKTYILSL